MMNFPFGIFGRNIWTSTDLHNLNLDWVLETVSKIAKEYPELIEEIEKTLKNVMEKPINEGEIGQVLTAIENGKSEWKSIEETFIPYIVVAVNNWLDAHPEATTTVLDNSITMQKLNNETVNSLKSIEYQLNPEIIPSVVSWKNIPTGYAFPQGFCVYDGFVYMGYSSPDNASNAIIQRVKNGITTNLTGEFYHMNSMCTDGTFIYSLDCLEGNPATTLNTVTVIDIETFSAGESITLNYTGNANLAGLMYNNGLYCMDTDGKVFSIDGNGDLTLYATLTGISGTVQQTFMNAQFIYVSITYPNMIMIYKHDGTLWNIINIGNTIKNVCPITEIEGVYIDNNNLYVRVSTITNEDLIIKCNTIKTVKSVPAMFDGNFVNNLYVDGNMNTQERINNLHFETIQNAINYASQFKNGKFIINLTINTNENIELNSENLSIRIDSAASVVYSGKIVIRAGNLTLQNITVDLTDIDEFIYITNSCNTDCNLSITGTIIGVASNYFIQTYGKCNIYCAVTADTANTINLGAYGNLEMNCNLSVNQAQYSNIYSNGVVNNISGYLRGGVPVAVSVNIPLITADTVISQTGRNPQQNTWVEIRTNDGSKNDFYLSTSNVQIQPFYVVNNNVFEVYYIRLRRDANNVLYAMLINPPSSDVSINLIIYH